MATASTIILSALRMIGEKPVGGTLTANEQTDYLYDLNAAMESWGIDRSMVYQLLQENHTLVSGTTSYTIGTGATINTTRPNKLDNPCFIRDANGIDTPLQIIDVVTYGRIGDKSTSGGTPEYIFYDEAYVSGLGTIYLYPTPGASLTLYFNSWKQLQNFALISTTLSMPPGYQLAIESNFALMKCAGYRNPDPALVKLARDSMARIKSINQPDTIMQVDPAVIGARATYDIYTS
jgi:hypothetical protein